MGVPIHEQVQVKRLRMASAGENQSSMSIQHLQRLGQLLPGGVQDDVGRSRPEPCDDMTG
jgi:hypothetical protein